MIARATDLLRIFWLPAAVLAAALLLWAPPLAFMPRIAAVPAYLVHGTALIGAFLGWRFGRSRAVLALAVLALLALALDRLLPTAPGNDASGRLLYPAAALLAAVNLAFLGFMPERGLFTLSGLSRLSLLLLQVVLLAWLVVVAGAELRAGADALLHLRALPESLDRWTWLPQPALYAFVAAALVLALRAWRSGAPLDAGLLGALLGAGLALHGVGAPPAPMLFLLAAVLCLVLALVQDSYRMAFVDELTGLPGRRALDRDMNGLDGAYAVAMLDVDHFKRVNDTYGHAVGDQILKMVAQALRRTRGGAGAYRYGGEEFTLLYPGLDAAAAMAAAETVRREVEASRFHPRGRDRALAGPERRGQRGAKPEALAVTVSIGLAQSGGDGGTPLEVLKAADRALYGAKRAGRNRVMRARPGRRRQSAVTR
jgi:GGDEF domain-containing protein